jgi:hypothetical protein
MKSLPAADVLGAIFLESDVYTLCISERTQKNAHHVIARAGKVPGFDLQVTLTCLGKAAAFILPTKTEILALFKVTWGIPILKTPSFTWHYRLKGLKIF